VAVSRELSAAVALMAAVLVLAWDAPAAVARVVAAMRAALGAALVPAASTRAGDRANVGDAAARAGLGAALLATVAVGLAQTGGLVAPVRVDLRRLGGGGSWRRVFDGRAAAAAGAGC
jgi:flagellar biosynthesis protein FlhB